MRVMRSSYQDYRILSVNTDWRKSSHCINLWKSLKQKKHLQDLIGFKAAELILPRKRKKFTTDFLIILVIKTLNSIIREIVFPESTELV